MIELRKVTKKYGEKVIFSDVTLSVQQNELLIIEGQSGSGKTTLLEVIGGVRKPTSGEVIRSARGLGVVFQDDLLIPWKTVIENLEFVCDNAADKRARAFDLLGRFGLSESANLLPREISGGMRRRLNMARALVVEPELLLIDEPFAFQDQISRTAIIDELSSLRSRTQCAVVLCLQHGEDFGASDAKRYTLKDAELKRAD